MDLRWRAPAQTGGAQLTGYQVVAIRLGAHPGAHPGARRSSVVATLKPRAASYTFRSRSAGSYRFEVVAVNAAILRVLGDNVEAMITRLLGVTPAVPTATVAAPEVSSRFKLTGIMAPKAPATHGVALISIDGKLPRAFSSNIFVSSRLTEH